MDTEPEPTADGETHPLSAMDIEPKPKPTMEPAAKSVPEAKPVVPVDQVCEPAAKSVPVGILLVIDEEESLINWESNVVLPTLPTHKPSLPLVPS